MAAEKPTTKRISSWWMGGAAAMGAASCTHPLDLVKVHLQTQQEARLGMLQMAIRVVKSEGILGLYAGLSASLLRQATYSTTRFAIYETVKKRIQPADGNLAFHQKVLRAAVSGLCGGIVGTPADMGRGISFSIQRRFHGDYTWHYGDDWPTFLLRSVQTDASCYRSFQGQRVDPFRVIFRRWYLRHSPFSTHRRFQDSFNERQTRRIQLVRGSRQIHRPIGHRRLLQRIHSRLDTIGTLHHFDFYVLRTTSPEIRRRSSHLK